MIRSWQHQSYKGKVSMATRAMSRSWQHQSNNRKVSLWQQEQ